MSEPVLDDLVAIVSECQPISTTVLVEYVMKCGYSDMAARRAFQLALERGLVQLDDKMRIAIAVPLIIGEVAMITAVQSRMARAGLGIGIREASAAAKISTHTLSRLESGEELRERTLIDIRRAYEEMGAEFIGTDTVRIKAGET